MKMKKKLIAASALLMLLFGAAQGAFAQTADDNLAAEVRAMNEAAVENPTAILTKLSAEFEVDLVVLQDFYAKGYSVGEIWLALEISAETTTTLADAILIADGTEGHGWGIFAQTLGIAPGSAEFHALRLRWGEHQGQMIRAMNQEREKNTYTKSYGEGNEKGVAEKSGGAGNSESAKSGGKN